MAVYNLTYTGEQVQQLLQQVENGATAAATVVETQSVEALPHNADVVVARLSTAATLGLDGAMDEGKTLTAILRNETAAPLSIQVPWNIGFVPCVLAGVMDYLEATVTVPAATAASLTVGRYAGEYYIDTIRCEQDIASPSDMPPGLEWSGSYWAHYDAHDGYPEEWYYQGENTTELTISYHDIGRMCIEVALGGESAGWDNKPTVKVWRNNREEPVLELVSWGSIEFGNVWVVPREAMNEGTLRIAVVQVGFYADVSVKLRELTPSAGRAQVLPIMTSESNPKVMAICYAHGLCASPGAMYADEAADVHELSSCDRYTGETTYFFAGTDIETFREFRHFVGLTGTYRAFCGCASLREIELPENFWSLSEGMFLDCSSLESIVLPENVTFICDGAFGGCSSLATIVCRMQGWSYPGYYQFPWRSASGGFTGAAVTGPKKLIVPTGTTGWTESPWEELYDNCGFTLEYN